MLINLTQYELIDISGVDAEKFLQGQVTCDVTKLAIGDSTLTAHCDPKGKISSIFRLIRLTEQQFYLFFRKELLPFGLDQLKKYAVFSKVTFTPVDVQLVGGKGKKSGQFSSSFSARLTVPIQDRLLWIDPAEPIECNTPEEFWDLWDMQQGYPILTASVQNEFIPQALNLQEIEQAISFQKGCYIGQETVARAKYRGTNKRAMYLFHAETDYQPKLGEELEMMLENGWRKTGMIISAVNINGELWLQAVLNNELEQEVKFRLQGTETLLQPQ